MALDAQDGQALKECLALGADPNGRRNSISPVWAVAQANRYDLLEILVHGGASIQGLGPNSQSIWAAIATRNSVDEGRRIQALNGGQVFGRASEMLKHKAWDLLAWWLVQPGSRPIPCPTRSSSGNNFRNWLVAGLHGKDDLIALINRAWEIDPTNPRSLVQQRGASVGRTAWEEIARLDDVMMAQRALRKGWGPPLPEDHTPAPRYEKEVEPWWGADLGWFLLSKRALNLWRWWVSVPAIKTRFIEDATRLPQDTLWPLARDVPMLEHLLSAGVEMVQRGPGDSTLLHHLVQTKHFGVTMAQWWLENLPHAYVLENADGVKPLDMPLGEATEAQRSKVRQTVMHARLPDSTPTAGKRSAQRTRL